MEMQRSYPLTFSVDYPDRELDRKSTFFRIFYAIPICIVYGALTGETASFRSGGFNGAGTQVALGGAGLLFLPPLLMILFRRKYPLWWAEWNRELMRFGARVTAYVALMNDQYPSTDEQQTVHLDFPKPNGAELAQWGPLYKWFLAIPHYIVLAFLAVISIGCVIAAWFAILFTGRYPRSLFDFVEGSMRWGNRVIAYAGILVTDEYPPFSMS